MVKALQPEDLHFFREYLTDRTTLPVAIVSVVWHGQGVVVMFDEHRDDSKTVYHRCAGFALERLSPRKPPEWRCTFNMIVSAEIGEHT